MVGDCGQTRHLDNVQSLATRQPSAKMHITKMLVMDWTFWESVHTGLQRWKNHHQKQNRYKKASDSLRYKHTHASEEFGRTWSGKRRDEPEKTKLQPTLAGQLEEKVFQTICRWVVLLYCFFRFPQLHTFSAGAYWHSCLLSVAHHSYSVLKQYRRFGLAHRI